MSEERIVSTGKFPDYVHDVQWPTWEQWSEHNGFELLSSGYNKVLDCAFPTIVHVANYEPEFNWPTGLPADAQVPSTIETVSAMEIDQVQVSTAVPLDPLFSTDYVESGTLELLCTQNGASELSPVDEVDDVLGLGAASEFLTLPYIATETSTPLEVPSVNESQILGDHIEPMELSL